MAWLRLIFLPGMGGLEGPWTQRFGYRIRRKCRARHFRASPQSQADRTAGSEQAQQVFVKGLFDGLLMVGEVVWGRDESAEADRDV
jgi:hypothetical protein